MGTGLSADLDAYDAEKLISFGNLINDMNNRKRAPCESGEEIEKEDSGKFFLYYTYTTIFIMR